MHGLWCLQSVFIFCLVTERIWSFVGDCHRREILLPSLLSRKVIVYLNYTAREIYFAEKVILFYHRKLLFYRHTLCLRRIFLQWIHNFTYLRLPPPGTARRQDMCQIIPFEGMKISGSAFSWNDDHLIRRESNDQTKSSKFWSRKKILRSVLRAADVSISQTCSRLCVFLRGQRSSERWEHQVPLFCECSSRLSENECM